MKTFVSFALLSMVGCTAGPGADGSLAGLEECSDDVRAGAPCEVGADACASDREVCSCERGDGGARIVCQDPPSPVDADLEACSNELCSQPGRHRCRSEAQSCVCHPGDDRGGIVVSCEPPPPPSPSMCTIEQVRECSLGIPSSCTYGSYSCRCVIFAGVGTWVCDAPVPPVCTPDNQHACELGQPSTCSYSGRVCHCNVRDGGGPGSWSCDELPPPVAACTMDDFNRCRDGEAPVCMYGAQRCSCTVGPLGITGWVCQQPNPSLTPVAERCGEDEVRRCSAGGDVSCVNDGGAACRCEDAHIVCG
jgi:hypothetical protein